MVSSCDSPVESHKWENDRGIKMVGGYVTVVADLSMHVLIIVLTLLLHCINCRHRLVNQHCLDH